MMRLAWPLIIAKLAQGNNAAKIKHEKNSGIRITCFFLLLNMLLKFCLEILNRFDEIHNN